MLRKIRCGGRPVTAIVLAGGRSRRMKVDKAGLPVRGGTLLGHVLRQLVPRFDETIVSVSRNGSARRVIPRGIRPAPSVVEDRAEGLGPLAGLLAGLEAARNEDAFVIACDMPEIDLPFVRKLMKAAGPRKIEIAVPVTPAGHYEPLFAVYKKPAARKIDALLRSGERSILPLFALSRTALVRLNEEARFFNLNTRHHYENYLRLSAGKNPSIRRARRSHNR